MMDPMQTNAIQPTEVNPAVREPSNALPPDWFEAMVQLMRINSELLRALVASRSSITPELKLFAHCMAIKALLEPQEIAQILALGTRTGDEQLQWLIDQVSALPVDAAASLIRRTLLELDQTKFTPRRQ